MSKSARLNLDGVKEHLSRQPRSGVNQAFTIATDENYPIATGITESSPNKSGMGFILCFLTVASVYGITASFQRVQPVETTGGSSVKQIDKGLRKILRMPCVTDGNTHCSTSSSGGDYVVSVGACKNIFEFNGIPFTDIKKDQHGNYHVPSSQDMSLTMINGCKDVSVTFDTYSIANAQHASKSQPSGTLRRVVWITKTCFKDFTLEINGQLVFDKTPVKMIDSQKLDNYTAYIYEVNGNIKGSVSVSGRGCASPINIYTLRSKY